jgi:N-acetylglucosamine kinase-like BadF-type ATPase
VFACAAEGDATAQQIVAESADELALAIVTVARKLDLIDSRGRGAFPLVLAGGVLEKSAVYAKAVEASVAREAAEVRVVRPSVEPCVGAAMLGWNTLQAAGTGTVGGESGSIKRQSSALL